MAKSRGGRPTVMTPEVIGKLEYVFGLGGSDREATFYAGINLDTLYEYQKRNPDFTERKEALKNRPVLKARETVVNSLNKPQHAEWYLEKRQRDEFGASRSIEVSKDGESISISIDV